MHVCHVMPARFPVARYGGAERAAYYLAKGLAELGHRNTFICLEGSQMDFAQVRAWDPNKPLKEQLPSSFDVLQLYATPSEVPECPYLVCIQGNGRAGEIFLPNTVFLSRDHAERHHWTEFVFNGIDPEEYPLERHKNSDELLFLAKASWPVKNLFGALVLADRVGCQLNVLGGEQSLWNRWRHPRARFYGMIGGNEKLRVLQRSQTLLFPVLWNEPFGVALIEALATGCSVVGSAWGSIPEIVDETCGAVASSAEEFVDALGRRKQWSSEACRERVESHFTHRHQAARYMEYYQRVVGEGCLRDGHPFCGPEFQPEALREIPGLPMSPRARMKFYRQRFL